MAKKKEKDYKGLVEAAAKKNASDLIPMHKAMTLLTMPELNKDIPKPGKGKEHK